MDTTGPNTDQIAYWNEAAGPVWVEMQTLLDHQLEPLGRAVIAGLGLRPGGRVLDVGCGCGQTTATLAEAVGADGEALGVDISEPMLAIARKRSAEARFLEADAQTYAFPAGRFDAIHSRFGVMFFDDPAKAFANLRSALKPGGRLGFVCWRSPDQNPIMTEPMAAAAPFLPPAEPPVPGAPGPFAFADPERLRAILTGAGFTDIAIAPQDLPAGGNSLEDTFRLSLQVGPLGRMLRAYPEGREPALGAIRDALASHVKDGRVWQDSATWLVSARNP